MVHTLLTTGYGGHIYTLKFDAAQSSLIKTAENADAGEAPTWGLIHKKRQYSSVKSIFRLHY